MLEVADRNANPALQIASTANRNHIDNARHGLCAIQSRRRSAQHLDPSGPLAGNQANVVLDGRDAVLQKQRLPRLTHHRRTGRITAHGNGSIHARILFDIDVGGLVQQVSQIVVGCLLDFLAGNHLDTLWRILQAHFRSCARYDDAIGVCIGASVLRCSHNLNRPCRLRHGSSNRRQAEKQACQADGFHFHFQSHSRFS